MTTYGLGCAVCRTHSTDETLDGTRNPEADGATRNDVVCGRAACPGIVSGGANPTGDGNGAGGTGTGSAAIQHERGNAGTARVDRQAAFVGQVSNPQREHPHHQRVTAGGGHDRANPAGRRGQGDCGKPDLRWDDDLVETLDRKSDV